jgi:hypothetical protein
MANYNYKVCKCLFFYTEALQLCKSYVKNRTFGSSGEAVIDMDLDGFAPCKRGSDEIATGNS